MKNEFKGIDVALSKIVDQTPHPRLSSRIIWLRGLALERQRAARRWLRITRLLSMATLLLVIVAGAAFVSTSTRTIVADQMAAAACAVVILGYTALQLMRSTR